MRTIITDIKDIYKYGARSDDNIPPWNSLNCIGCFKCWTKNHYECVLKDGACNNGNKMLLSDEIYIITKSINGCYSSTVKKILERSINFVKPHFKIREGMIHHYLRNDCSIPCHVIVYNKICDRDKKTFEKLVKANNINFTNLVIDITYIDEDRLGDIL